MTATIRNAIAELKDRGYLTDETRRSLNPYQLQYVQERALEETA